MRNLILTLFVLAIASPAYSLPIDVGKTVFDFEIFDESCATCAPEERDSNVYRVEYIDGYTWGEPHDSLVRVWFSIQLLQNEIDPSLFLLPEFRITIDSTVVFGCTSDGYYNNETSSCGGSDVMVEFNGAWAGVDFVDESHDATPILMYVDATNDIWLSRMSVLYRNVGCDGFCAGTGQGTYLNVVPEPSTAILMGCALAALSYRGSRARASLS